MKDLLAVINEQGEIVGVFHRPDYAEAFIVGLHQEQMHKVGSILQEYMAVPVDPEKVDGLWKPRRVS